MPKVLQQAPHTTSVKSWHTSNKKWSQSAPHTTSAKSWHTSSKTFENQLQRVTYISHKIICTTPLVNVYLIFYLSRVWVHCMLENMVRKLYFGFKYNGRDTPYMQEGYIFKQRVLSGEKICSHCAAPHCCFRYKAHSFLVKLSGPRPVKPATGPR